MSATGAPRSWTNRILVATSCITAAVLLLANWPAVQVTLTTFWETGVPADILELLALLGVFIVFIIVYAKASDRFDERRTERAEVVALQIVVLAVLDSARVDPAVFQAAKAERWAEVAKKLAKSRQNLVDTALWKYEATRPRGEGMDAD